MRPHGPQFARNEVKDKQRKPLNLKVLNYFKKYLPLIIMALLFAITSTVLQVLGPDKIKDLTAQIGLGLLTPMNIDAIWQIGLTLIIFYASSLLLRSIQSFAMATVTAKSF